MRIYDDEIHAVYARVHAPTSSLASSLVSARSRLCATSYKRQGYRYVLVLEYKYANRIRTRNLCFIAPCASAKIEIYTPTARVPTSLKFIRALVPARTKLVLFSSVNISRVISDSLKVRPPRFKRDSQFFRTKRNPVVSRTRATRLRTYV